MTASGFAVRAIKLLALVVLLAAELFAATARAQTLETKSVSQARVVVVGDGSVTVTPDYARIGSGVSTSAKTKASYTNSKAMANVIAALMDAGIAKKDIQTSEFSIEPVYVSPTPPGGPKLSGYRIANKVNVTIHQIPQVVEILDRLVKAGATDAGNIAFPVSDREKALDQAREAAIANARHKADLYARALGLNLGRVAWISEGSDFEPLAPMESRMKLASPAPPIESGEDTITARVTVGFDIAQ